MCTRIDGDVATITFVGELDLFSGPTVVSSVREVLGAGMRFVCIDLGGVTFIGSAAMSSLLRVMRDVAAENGGLALVCDVSGPVHRLLEITGLNTVLHVHDDLATAQGAVRTSSAHRPREPPS